MSAEIKKALALAKEVEMVDLRFTDLLGMWHHFTISASELMGELFEEGIEFDGSSIRGFQEIHEYDEVRLRTHPHEFTLYYGI